MKTNHHRTWSSAARAILLSSGAAVVLLGGATALADTTDKQATATANGLHNRTAAYASLATADTSALQNRLHGSSEHEYLIDLPKDWVKPVTPFDPKLERSADDSYGFRSRLQDYQYNGVEPGRTSSYYATEYELTNRYGVENYSTVEINFDPSYEKLTLHEISVLRGTEIIDKLSTSRRTVLQREKELDALIYDGTQTLAIVLNDVRVGDTVRYAYSLAGENPILADNREIYIRTERSNPLDRQYTRILSSIKKPFYRRVRGPEQNLVITRENGIEEVILDQYAIAETSYEEYVPSRHNRRGAIVFSDMADWKSVNDWALPMYQIPKQTAPELVTIASAIRSAHDDSAAQIGAALKWVQDEVRYFGVELGTNSHWPSRPQETLGRRYGDCKDKTLLTIALLNELGVEAQPALVNTNRHLDDDNYPLRLHAFDHVIVHVEHEGKSHFIDPTIGYQKGALGEFHEPNYGHALVLKEGTSELTPMNEKASGKHLAVTKTLTIAANADEQHRLDVETQRVASLAENIRYRLETEGPRTIGADYQEYYEDYFEGIEASRLLSFTEADAGSLEISEAYRFDDIWMNDKNVDEYVWIYGDEIIGYLDKPDKASSREQPYELLHPIIVEEIWHVSLPYAMRLDELDKEIDNEWMSLSKTHTLDASGTRLTVSMRYETKVDEVAAKDLVAYRRAALAIEDAASFYIENSPAIAAAKLNQKNADASSSFPAFAGKSDLSRGLFVAAVVVVSLFLTWLGLFLAFRRLDKAQVLD